MIKQRILLLATLCSLVGGTLMAQRGPHHPRFPQMTEELKASLQLTPEQVTQLEDLKTTTQAAVQALREQENLDQESKRTQMHTIHEQSKTKLETILTPTQLEQLHTLSKERMQEHRAQNKGMREEMKAYRQTNIEPVMRAQRQKLEAQLSAEDKAFLAKTRATMAAARAEHQAQRKAERKAKMADGAPKGDRQHEPRQQHHRGHDKWANFPAEKQALAALVTKYDNTISALLEAVAPQREQWHADQKAIRDRYRPTNEEQAEHKGKGREHGEAHDKDRKAMGAKIRFLLMDPDAPAQQAEKPNANAFKATAYPNPTSNTTTLNFEIETASGVRIDVKDESGNVVKTITRENFTPGKHQLQVDLSELQNGTYYLTLSSRSLAARQSVKVVVVK